MEPTVWKSPPALTMDTEYSTRLNSQTIFQCSSLPMPFRPMSGWEEEGYSRSP